MIGRTLGRYEIVEKHTAFRHVQGVEARPTQVHIVDKSIVLGPTCI